MNTPWSAEQVVTETLAKKLIEEEFPELKPVEVSLLGKGFDNTVYEVNKLYVFRFPRREIAVRLLEIEKQILPKLASKVEMAIPVPVFFGNPSKDYKWMFLGYHKVAGETPSELSEVQRISMAAPLAEFLKTVHAFPAEIARKHGAEDDHFGRLDLKKRIPMLQANIDKLKQIHKGEISDRMQHYLDSLSKMESVSAEHLVHGDLHIRNILIDKDGALSGIIDWGDTHIGDPAVDLSIVYSLLPPEARETFFGIYGKVTEDTKELARFKAIYTHSVLMVYGYDLQDLALVQSAETSIHLALF
ncbi:phosphotransferase [Metabacillus idriensis]|uniref:phosphotransferase n=1 Tax=Metabacillus idriensis TaxID=324768 RepID=UPI0017480E68|nr:phosphotransferase [Metabacillus idriensis]